MLKKKASIIERDFNCLISRKLDTEQHKGEEDTEGKTLMSGAGHLIK